MSGQPVFEEGRTDRAWCPVCSDTFPVKDGRLVAHINDYGFGQRKKPCAGSGMEVG